MYNKNVEKYKNPIDKTLETINIVLGRNLTAVEIEELRGLMMRHRRGEPMMINSDAPSSKAFKVITGMLGENDINQIMKKLRESSSVAIPKTEPIIKNEINKPEISLLEKMTEKDMEWLEDRFGIEVYDGGAIGRGDTPPQKIHDNMSGATFDSREDAWVEAERKAGPGTPFTFIYDYYGRVEKWSGKYLIAVAGWTLRGVSNGDRNGIVSVNIKYAKGLHPRTEEWLLKKAVEEYERNFKNNRDARIRYSKEFERLEFFGNDKTIKFDPSQIKGYTSREILENVPEAKSIKNEINKPEISLLEKMTVKDIPIYMTGDLEGFSVFKKQIDKEAEKVLYYNARDNRHLFDDRSDSSDAEIIIKKETCCNKPIPEEDKKNLFNVLHLYLRAYGPRGRSVTTVGIKIPKGIDPSPFMKKLAQEVYEAGVKIGALNFSELDLEEKGFGEFYKRQDALKNFTQIQFLKYANEQLNSKNKG